MVSTQNSWNSLREQLMRIESVMIPTAPLQKETRSMHRVIHDDHWIEFDVELLLAEKKNSKAGCSLSVARLHQAIVVTSVSNENQSLRSFDTILTLNEIDFSNLSEATARCILDAHRGKMIHMRVRRLQPSFLETMEFDLADRHAVKSSKLGLTIDGGIGKNDGKDPGLFVTGIASKGRAAGQGLVRIGDRLMQISNSHVSIHLQYLELDTALKLINRMRNESRWIKLVVAHPSQP